MKVRSGLEKLIEIKEKNLDIKRGEMAKIVATQRHIKASLRQLRTQLAGLTLPGGEEVDPNDLFIRSGGGAYVVHQLEIQEEELDQLVRLEEGKRREVVALHRELQGYNRIHRERRNKVERELQRKHRREVDDLFSTRTTAP